MQIIPTVPVDDDTIAVIVAALQHYLAAEQSIAAAPKPSAWAVAGIYANQGLEPGAGPAGWPTAERRGQALRRSSGILGTFD